MRYACKFCSTSSGEPFSTAGLQTVVGAGVGEDLQGREGAEKGSRHSRPGRREDPQHPWHSCQPSQNKTHSIF